MRPRLDAQRSRLSGADAVGLGGPVIKTGGGTQASEEKEGPQAIQSSTKVTGVISRPTHSKLLKL